MFKCLLSLIGVLLFCATLCAQESGDERIPIEEANKPGYKLEKLIEITEVEVTETDKGYKFTVRGTTKYPDKTNITCTIRFMEQKLTNGSVAVGAQRGQFEAVFEPERWEGKKFYSGNYKFEVFVDAEVQMFKVREEMKALGVFRNDYHSNYRYIGDKSLEARQQNEIKEHFKAVVAEAWKLFDELNSGIEKGGWKVSQDVKDGKKLRKKRYYKYDSNKKKTVFDKERWQKERTDPSLREMFKFYKGEEFQAKEWFEWLTEWTPKLAQLSAKHRNYSAGYVIPKYPNEHELFNTIILELLSFSHSEAVRIFDELKRAGDNVDFPNAEESRRLRRVTDLTHPGIDSAPLPYSDADLIKSHLKQIEAWLDLKGVWDEIDKMVQEEMKRQEQEKEKQKK